MTDSTTNTLTSRTPIQSAPWRGLTIVFFVSLAVRLLVFTPVATSNMAPMFDEVSYVGKAVGFEKVIRALVQGGLFWATPAAEDIDRAYGTGHYPPLHPFLLGAGFFLFGRELVVARLMVVLQSALATCLVYSITTRLASRRAAGAAAALHILYPGFMCFAHFLWSETTYILIVLAAIYCVVRTVNGTSTRAPLAWAIFAGVLLGLAGNTRAAVLPLLVAVPAWLVLTLDGRVRRVLLPGAVFGAALLTLLPWLWTLAAREGRFVALSSGAGYTLYLKNNPWGNETQAEAKTKIRATISDYMRNNDVGQDIAARTLALEYIRSDPLAFALRGFQKFKALWAPDWFIMRHALYAIYPPRSGPWLVVAWIALLVSFVLLAASVVAGLLYARGTVRHASLLWTCVLLGMTPHLVSVGNTRMALPLLALLLPIAGAGLAELLRKHHWKRGSLVLALTLIVFAMFNPFLPREAIGLPKAVSAHYSPMLAPIMNKLGEKAIATQDRILLRSTADRVAASVRATILSPGYRFAPSGTQTVTWSGAASHQTQELKLRSEKLEYGPPTVKLEYVGTDLSATLHPADPGAWRRWQPTGLSGVEYIWLGSAGSSPEEVAALLGD